MILPAECDYAVDALLQAVDALRETGAPMYVIEAFVEAHQATSRAVRRVDDHRRAEAVEARHVECQTFPWTEEP